MKYKIVSALSKETIEDEVNDFIEKGWILQGGMSISSDDDWDTYAQALVFIDDENGKGIS